MKIVVINGPNLNLLGRRDPGVYGHETLKQIMASLQDLAAQLDLDLEFSQSNSEGGIVDAIQAADRIADGVVLNAAAYTHTSVAVRDAVSAVAVPVVEVHISQPLARESFRHTSLLAPVVEGTISGFGSESYALALYWFHRQSTGSGDKRALFA